MPSATEPSPPENSPPGPPLATRLARWNRKLHFYSGLFLLFFLWLFAFTGLILNHPQWTFHDAWTTRHETNSIRAITPLGPEIQGDLSQAREIMKQLGLEGDILWTTTRSDPTQFEFQARRPGHFYFLKADLAQNRVTLRQADVNPWGVLKVLHVFTGASLDDPRQTRDWALATLWAYTMDAVAIGLIFMILSSLYMCYELPQKRLPGAIALILGTLTCGLFCLGLRWLY